jgi:hypothetical protein
MVVQAYNSSTPQAEQEDCELKASLDYIDRPCLKNKETKETATQVNNHSLNTC